MSFPLIVNIDLCCHKASDVPGRNNRNNCFEIMVLWIISSGDAWGATTGRCADCYKNEPFLPFCRDEWPMVGQERKEGRDAWLPRALGQGRPSIETGSGNYM